MVNKDAKYDLILFGVTGFTGTLAAEYLMSHPSYSLKWAVSARNLSKAQACLQQAKTLAEQQSKEDSSSVELPEILVADLVCTTPEQEDALRDVVRQTKVVLTCSGPFEKYGQTLVKLCAELGVYYADITGETDYFRQTISKHDKTAQESGAVILCHCGHDCIPCDTMVWELNQKAKSVQATLENVTTYQEFGEGAASGGTINTAYFQLSKERSTKDRAAIDPLVLTKDGQKSSYSTKNITPKSDIAVPDLPGRTAGPWIMGPVMVNCVKRSNALLGYSESLQYGDVAVRATSWSTWFERVTLKARVGAALVAPSLFQGLLPPAGEGPPRDAMEAGHLHLYARATLKDTESKHLEACWKFGKDTGYLYTAALLCETGVLLSQQYGQLEGGCKTPASAFGGSLTQRLLETLECSLEVKVVES